MGVPATMIVTKPFESDAKFNAQGEGLEDLAVIVLPVNIVMDTQDIEKANLGDFVADEVIKALIKEQPQTETEAAEGETIQFSGGEYTEAWENMEKYFLQHRWSDGFPLVPPTQAAVSRMLEGTELSPDHVVGLIEPSCAEATVRKIAINAVMAGCLPQHMPVILAAVEAISDPLFDLHGIQTTTGPVSPLLIVSGPKLIEKLNINDSYSTIGPGWRANTTIGRAIRLIMINIGLAWPGKNDMKAFGNPFKYVTLMAENEDAYLGSWEPIRVAEGFSLNDMTISVMPAVGFPVQYMMDDECNIDRIIELLTDAALGKYNRSVHGWGLEDLILLTPGTFEYIWREGFSRIEFQKKLYESLQMPSRKFFANSRTSRPDPTEFVSIEKNPKWLAEKCEECKKNPEALFPMHAKPENIKIIVAGGPGTTLMAYVSNWIGRCHFVTKPVKLPKNWDNLLDKYKGWETPIIRSKGGVMK
ncbi:hypothetical protein ACFLWU_06155 [Chloroflexota bacterium]